MVHVPTRFRSTRLAAVMFVLLLALAAAAVALPAAGAATTSTPVTSVTIKAYKFRPDKFTVPSRTPIVVKNKDGATHDLTAVNGKFTTGDIEGGKSRKFTVKKPGTYKIVCTIHPYMTGTLTAT